MNGTTYIVVSHFNDNGESMLDKMARLLKSDIQNIENENLQNDTKDHDIIRPVNIIY